MSPEEAREAMLDAAMSSVDKKNRPQWAYEFNYLTRRGFSISLDSVRDHSACDCHGTGLVDGEGDHDEACYESGDCNGECAAVAPCPGGSPVVWSTEP